MGLYDSVWVTCPHCGKPAEFQSKAGPVLYLANYTLDNAPPAILLDISDAPEYHQSCGGWLAVANIDDTLKVVKVRAPDNPGTHHQGYKWWPPDLKFTPDMIETTP